MATFNGTEGNDTLIGGAAADDLHGFGGNDFLQGGGSADTVLGDAGNDTMSGNDGDDWVRGGTGNDQVTGGGGRDSFAFGDFGSTNADVMTDFSGGWDNIQLDVSAFTGLGATGRFASGDVRFFAGTAAHDADDRIIYNSATGQLWYDADGNGSAAAQLIAALSNRASMSATDIWAFNSGTPTPSPTPTPTPGVINGTEGNDTLIGTAGSDTINGFGGNDSIRGAEGPDSMSGGEGNDTLDGDNGPSDGNDPDVDTMAGGFGNDLFIVDNPADVVVDAGGIDTIRAENMNYTLGGSFENLQMANGATETSRTGIGNDLDNVLDGITGGYRVVLDGRGGNDTIQGSAWADTLMGGDGNDLFNGWDLSDSMDGGAGNDTLFGSTGNDTMTGGTGADTLVLFDDGDVFTDFVPGTDTIRLDGNFLVNVGANGRFVAGDERFYAAPGATAAHDATDRVIYNTTTGDLYYDFDGTGSSSVANVAATLQGAPSLSATDFEVTNGTAPTPSPTPSPTPTPTPIPAGSIVGTSGNDGMQGTNGNDSIFGLAGNDTIFANGGNDWVQGGAGNDQVSGGSGQDIYAFAEYGAANADSVANFGSGWDAIRLDAAGFSNIGATGRFAGGDVRFFAAAGATSAHDADDRIVYNTSNGQLFYDADGAGGAAAELIGTFTGAPGMAAADITVFGTATPSPTPSPTPTPTPGAINGTAGNDSLVGTAGNDTINGFGGNDTLDGGAGADTMDGGTGDDVYFVDREGADVIIETQNGGIDVVHTQSNYTLPAWVNNLVMHGFSHTGTGNEIDNVIDGRDIEGAGLRGMGGNDLLMTGDHSGIHRMEGGDGNDTLQGGRHTSVMSGDAGNDVLQTDSAEDSLTGGTGNDSFVFLSPSGTKTLTDFVSGVDEIRLDGRSFTQIGASGDFAAGDGRFHAAAGATAHDADDRIVYDTSSGNLYYDADGNGAGTAELIAILQGAPGLAAADFAVNNGSTPTPTPGSSLSGTNGNDTIVGTAGNDTIFANSGNDWIEGRGGNDSISGGSGLDSYVFREFGAANADQVLNFSGNNWDSLRFDNAAFTALGGDGRFAAGDGRFWSAAGATSAHDADDRLVYNTSTGQLYYDADGAGGAGAQLVATIQGAPAVVAPDVWVI